MGGDLVDIVSFNLAKQAHERIDTLDSKVVESSGENANGYWVTFGNDFQICTFLTDRFAAPANSRHNVPWTFPQPFFKVIGAHVTIYCIASSPDTPRYLHALISNITNTSLIASVYSEFVDDVNINLYLTVLGRR